LSVEVSGLHADECAQPGQTVLKVQETLKSLVIEVQNADRNP